MTKAENQKQKQVNSWGFMVAQAMLASEESNIYESEAELIQAEKDRNGFRLELLASQLDFVESFNRGEREDLQVNQAITYCIKTGQAIGIMCCDSSDVELTSVAPQWIETGDNKLPHLSQKEPIGFVVYLLGKLVNPELSYESVKQANQAKAKIYAALINFDNAKRLAGFVSVLKLAISVANKLHSSEAKGKLTEAFQNASQASVNNDPSVDAQADVLRSLNRWIAYVLQNLTNGYAQKEVKDESNALTSRLPSNFALTANENIIANALRGMLAQTTAPIRGFEVGLMDRDVKEASVVKQKKRAELKERQDMADMFTSMMQGG